ncbi:uncharacterized protein LOC128670199 isoform X2 [Plodia interpunctella]|uniref:uncharacterized protein LOC128670199 isoform X2 n=1 Tax=Plodia interpunctella TaxID=58824 RepID=UPI0023685578|nr:uncharacterized protein LOC128670199 isoform X2 [Plodia interpunctella]
MGDDLSIKEKMSQIGSYQWVLGVHPSNISNVSDMSDYGPPPFALQIIPKNVGKPDRPLLQATTEELLCFFFMYVSTIAKMQLAFMFDESINGCKFVFENSFSDYYLNMGDDMSNKEKISQAESTQWAFGAHESNASMLSRFSDSVGPPPFGLHIIPQVMDESDRPRVQATTEELFCFYRLYISTICKTKIMSMVDLSLNWYFWFHIQNLVLNCMPNVFVKVFLAVYVPEEHFYLDKMVPLLRGYKFVIIIAAFYELVRLTSCKMLLLHYIWIGLAERSPWNRCSKDFSYPVSKMPNMTVSCYVIEDFKKLISEIVASNHTISFYKYEYTVKYSNGTTTYFQVPQLTFFKLLWDRRVTSIQQTEFGVYFLIIYALAALHYNQFYKKLIWKLLKFANYAEIAITLLITIHIFLSYNIIDPHLKNVKPVTILYNSKSPKLEVDVVLLALNAPPVIHVLISRSCADHSKIQYKSLSALLVISFWSYTFLSGLMFKYLKDYCDNIMGVHIRQSLYNSSAFYFIYAIYYSHFLLGNIYFLITLFVKFMGDFYIFVITFHCLVEAIICEWKFVTRIMVGSFLSLLSLLHFLIWNFTVLTMLMLYMKCISILIEMYKIYEFLVQIHKPTIRLFWWIPVAFLIAGMLFTIYDILYLQGRNYFSLFCPIPEWGPVDFKKRRNRKLFKKHEYIGSQADRDLSRHMLSRDECDLVHLDLKYESFRRSTNVPYFSYEYESNKKKL